VSRSLEWLGRIESERGALAAAVSVFKDALVQISDSGLSGHILGFTLAWKADSLARTGDSVHAARLFGAAEAQLRRAGVALNPILQLSPGGGVRAAQETLGPDEFARDWQAGYGMDLAQVFAYALDEVD
jgi:hypothetical protein